MRPLVLAGTLLGVLASLLSALVLLHLGWRAWVRRRFPVHGVRVAFEGGWLRVVRKGRGRPVLLVHGMNGVAEDFPAALLDALAREHAVAALDRPAHGGSTRSRGALDLAANARAVLAALATCPEGHAVLVGHSYGAAVVLRAALDAPPGRVAGVVLLSPCTRVDARNERYVNLAIPPGRRRRLALWTLTLPVALFTVRGTRRDAWHPTPPPPGWSASRAWALVPSQLEAALENFATLPADLGRLAAELPGLAATLEVLVGDGDLVTPASVHAGWLPQAVPGATLRVLHGTGHWLPRERVDDVVAAVARAGIAGT